MNENRETLPQTDRTGPELELALEDLALELLPAAERLPQALRRAQDCQKNASASKALAAARDCLELIDTDWGTSHVPGVSLARARLLEAIALRRLRRFAEAQESYRQAEAALTGLPAELEKEAHAIRAELLLDRAISAFVRDDQLESARLNERAANLAQATGHLHEAARGLLNAAISWDRLRELAECRKCLGRASRILQELPRAPLHTSLDLFAWRLQIDHGPLSPAPALPPSATQSQQTLFGLYRWEQSLLTSDHATVQALSAAATQRTRELGEKQFDDEIRTLTAATSFLFEGKKADDLLSVAEIQDSERRPNGSLAMLGGWCQELLSQGKWKSLLSLSRFASAHPHPVAQAWGARSAFWLACRGQDHPQAQAQLELSRKLAHENGLAHFLVLLELEGKAYQSVVGLQLPETATPWERHVFGSFTSLLPGAGRGFLCVTPQGSRAVEEAEGFAELAQPRPATLCIDGIRNEIRAGGTTVSLEKKPIQKKLIFALLAAYPRSVSKEELIGLVWDELYNPLAHDAIFHRAVARLRRLVPRLKSEIVAEAGALRWKGASPFVALIPAQQSERQSIRLSERQIRMLTLLKYRGKLSRSEVVKALETSERTAVRDLAVLVHRKLILRSGQGPATVYYPAQ